MSSYVFYFLQGYDRRYHYDDFNFVDISPSCTCLLTSTIFCRVIGCWLTFLIVCVLLLKVNYYSLVAFYIEKMQ